MTYARIFIDQNSIDCFSILRARHWRSEICITSWDIFWENHAVNAWIVRITKFWVINCHHFSSRIRIC